MIASEMVKYFDTIINKKAFDSKDSDAIIAPLVEAMKMEGYYGLKPPCYFEPLVNHDDPTCLHGAPFNANNSQRIMAGDFDGNQNVTVHTDDNFHLVQDIHPIHLAQFNNTCD